MKVLIAALLSLISIHSYSQKVNEKFLLGTWQVVDSSGSIKFQFSDSMKMKWGTLEDATLIWRRSPDLCLPVTFFPIKPSPH